MLRIGKASMLAIAFGRNIESYAITVPKLYRHYNFKLLIGIEASFIDPLIEYSEPALSRYRIENISYSSRIVPIKSTRVIFTINYRANRVQPPDFRIRL
jgi:hypothetical protein